MTSNEAYPKTMQVREIEHCWLPMPDGVRLSARLWLPEISPAPAIIEYIPYRKRDMVRARDERNHPWFAARGYACIRVDMRGSGDSEGCMPDMYCDAELDDALEVLSWIAKQEWSNGAIGMMGTSWGGTSALQAAASGSGLLKAIIAVCATNNRYDDDIHHMGGCLLTDSIEWGATLPAILALPPTAEFDPTGWRTNWLERLERLEFPLFSWIEHETRDAYWRHGSVNETPGNFDCPVLAIGGWSDRYSNTVMNLLTDNPDNCWGIVGPWGHHYPDQGTPGPAIGFQQEALRWWDHWLRASDNGVDQDPRLRVWCNEYQRPADFSGMRHGRWLTVPDWPVSQECSEYDLTVRDLNASADYIHIPNNLLVGTSAGDTGYFGRPGGLPTDQSEDDSRSLVFETEALTDNCILLGKASVKLELKIEGAPTQIVVRLNDVAADGKIARVAYQIVNLKLDKTGQPCNQTLQELEITFPNAAYQFATGHRLRIALSTSYWPMIWPAAMPANMAIDSSRAILKIPQPSTRTLNEENPGFAASHALVDRNPALIADRIKREISLDDDTLVYRWRQPLAMARHASVNLEIGAETRAEHSININDPLSAYSYLEHRLVTLNGEQKIETRGTARVRADGDIYQVEGSLRVFENDTEFFSRDWSRDIERKYG